MRFIYIILCVFTSLSAFAQQFGGNPPSTKWKQINTSYVQIIFPDNLDSASSKIANIVNILQRNYSSTIGNKLKKVSIVLQNEVTYSNAYVSLAPYRSEFYLVPPQNAFELGAQNWAYTLATHEFRHVQQYSNFNVGLSKTMSVLFGGNGQALANAASIPDWFFEGDAVYNETMLSKQGRGRLPLFFNGFKSLYYDGKQYNYMQLRNGSLKNYTPDHYELGYLLVAYGREKYGNDFWKHVTHDAASFKPLFYPLQSNIKKQTGKNYNQFISDAFTFFHQQWKDTGNYSAAEWLTKVGKNNVVNYKYPYKSTNGSLIVLKNSFEEIPAFYRVDSNNIETKIAVRAIGYDDYFSYNNGKIIYTSLQPDIRWSNREYSIINLLDVKSRKTKKFTSHTKYFSPDISHNGKMMAAIEITPQQKSNLILFDENGQVKRTWSNNDNLIYSYPKFSVNDSFLFVITRNDAGEMGIEKRNLFNAEVSQVLLPNNRIIGFPVVQGDTLLYTCSNNGKDEILAFVNSQDKHYCLASYKTGLYQGVNINNENLIASTFTADGYRLGKFTARWQSINQQADTLANLYLTKPFVTGNNLLDSIHINSYSARRYSKVTHPFNLHSWAPFINYPDYSFIIFGENILNTFKTQLYYTYNTNENYSRAGLTEIYGGWYVQPFIDVSNTWNRNVRLNTDTTFSWNELNGSAGLRLPLNFTGGKWYRNLTLNASYNINQVQYSGLAKQVFKNFAFSYLQAQLMYAAQIQQARKQIYPHLAYSFFLQFRKSANNTKAHQFLFNSNIYLPGIVKNQSIVLNAAYQLRDTARNYFFDNNFPFSRGYEAFDFPRMLRVGVNYHFPLLYPDWGFANLTYLLRVRANIFFDYTNAKSLRTGNHFEFNSFGTELFFDTKWWNQQPLTIGIRYSRLLNYGNAGMLPNRWEAILPVTFF